MLPGVATPPMLLSITADSALLTMPQLSVADCPAVSVVGEAVMDSMFGVPAQVVAAPFAMRIVTFNVTPKNAPSRFRIRQKLLYVPGAVGAVIGTLKSTLRPGAVTGTPIGVVAVTCPLK